MAEAASLDRAPRPGPPSVPAAKTWSRRRSMGDWVRLVAATNGVVLVLNLFTGIVSARVMGPAGKGVFNAVAVWTSVFTSLSGMGVGTAFVSVYARADDGDRPWLARAAMFLGCFWGLLGSATVYFLEPHLVGHLAPRAAAWARFSSPMVAIFVIAGMGGAMLSVSQRFGQLNWLRLARTLLYALGVGGLAAFGWLTPYTQLATSWVLFVAGNVLTLTLGVTLLPLRAGWVRLRDVWHLASLGIRYYSLGLLGMFNSQLDQMIASAWLSAGDMGLYAVAISSLSVVGMLQVALSSIMFPMMAADSKEAVVARTLRVLRRMTPLFLVLMLLVCACAWPVLLLMYGRAYLGAVGVVLVIAPTAAFMGTITIFYQGCYALRWFAGPTMGEGVGAGTGAILLAVLIPRWGLTGAAWADTISYALDALVVTVFWCRASRTHPRDLLPTRSDVRLLFAELRRVPVVSRLVPGLRL